MGTWARLFALLLLVSASAFGAGWDISYLDGSSAAEWTYENLAGGGSIVDLGGGNHAIECLDYQDPGYSEYWRMVADGYLTLGGAFRFAEIPADPGYFHGIFMQLLPGGGGAPMIGWAVRNGYFTLVDAYDTSDLLPMVKPLDLNVWHSCGLTINQADSRVIGWFDGQIVFNDFVDDPVDFGSGYAEFGASTYWGGLGAARVQWDWLGVGSGEVVVPAVPEPSSLAGLLGGIVSLAALVVKRQVLRRA